MTEHTNITIRRLLEAKLPKGWKIHKGGGEGDKKKLVTTLTQDIVLFKMQPAVLHAQKAEGMKNALWVALKPSTSLSSDMGLVANRGYSIATPDRAHVTNKDIKALPKNVIVHVLYKK